MPYLIDGYNLYHAACKFSEEFSHITPQTLCKLIAEDMRHLRDYATIVFDGRQPRGMSLAIEPTGYVKIIYSGPAREADELLEKLIRKNTAPRRLVMVSSDNRLRREARRRRAASVKAHDYLTTLQRRREQPPRIPAEPPEKRHGLPNGELDQWLEMFGFDPEQPYDPTDRMKF